MKVQIILFFIGLLLVTADPIPKPKLKVVTIVVRNCEVFCGRRFIWKLILWVFYQSPPYVTVKDGVLSGFAIDLLAKIAETANFDYERYLSPDGKQGVVESANKINGMLGEIADGVSCTKQQKMI